MRKRTFIPAEARALWLDHRTAEEEALRKKGLYVPKEPVSRKEEVKRPDPKNCANCGEPFYENKKWQLFCGPTCRNTYNNDKATSAREAKLREREELLKEVVELRSALLKANQRIKELEEKLCN